MKKAQQHIVNFQPICLKFSKPLEYQGVNKSFLDARVAHLEVCVVQKFTRKSFVVAMWNMPLSMAVKKLVKEKFPLKAYLSTALPENMKVYAIKENIQLSPCESRGDLQENWAIPYPEDSPQVLVTSPDIDSNSCKIDFDKPEPSKLSEVRVMKHRRSKDSEEVAIPGLVKNEANELTKVEVHKLTSKHDDIHINMPAEDSRDERRQGRRFKKKSPVKKPASFKPAEVDFGDLPSRPETPIWDDYMEPLSFEGNVDCDMDHYRSQINPGAIVLPMQVSLSSNVYQKTS